MEVDFRLENLPQIPPQPPELLMAAAELEEESQEFQSRRASLGSVGCLVRTAYDKRRTA